MSSSYVTDYINSLILIVIILGPIGNILVFKIYSTPTMTKTSMSIYFRAMSINDTINLINLLVLYLIHEFNFDPSQWIGFLCRVENYFSYVQSPTTAWLMVVISLDRFFNITYPPRKFPLRSKKPFQLIISFFIIIYNYIYYSFIIWNSYLVPDMLANNTSNGTVCEWNFDVEMLGWMDFCNSTAVPFALMVLLSAMLMGSMIRSRARVRMLDGFMRQAHAKLMNQRDRRFAITIVSMNIVFLGLNLPVEIYDLFVLVDNLNRVYYFLSTLYYMHSGTSFYVQVAFNRAFRKQLWAILKIKVSSTILPSQRINNNNVSRNDV
jgi:hypothetical protein